MMAEKKLTIVPAEEPMAPVTPMDMIKQAVEKGSGVETITKLMDLQERWQANEARLAFEEAVAKAREQVKPVAKKAKVSFGTGKTAYSHETLADIEDMLRPIYSPLGLSWRWESDQDGPLLKMTCIISHKMGHQTRTTLQGPNDTSGSKNPMQAVGSSCTYLQRYTLKLAAGLAASVDDDAQAATPGNESITEKQLSELSDLIKATDTDVTKFAAALGIEDITEMPNAKYQTGMALLRKKQAKMKAGK